MEHLSQLLEEKEGWLVEQILGYAQKRDYTRYTSTLREAWRVSIAGISNAIQQAIIHIGQVPELGPDEDFSKDPICCFGTEEARKHRARGVSLSMFLGLMKYYRQSYLDMVERFSAPKDAAQYGRFIQLCFDRIEIGFCTTWTEQSENEKLEELINANRAICNEKNKYLAIFESIRTPVFFLDDKNRVENANQAAMEMLLGEHCPGAKFYSPQPNEILLPWMIGELVSFRENRQESMDLERQLHTLAGPRYFHVHLKRIQDVSAKFKGTVMILHDITEKNRIENELIQASIRDELTGLLNRRGFYEMAKERLLLTRRIGMQSALMFGDLDELKIINDRMGHQEGDQALVEVAQVLTMTFRQSDILSRLGGDEFVIFSSGVTKEIVDNMAERLQQNLFDYSTKNNRPYVLSLSVGTVYIPAYSYHSIDQLLQTADQEMYENKKKVHPIYADTRHSCLSIRSPTCYANQVLSSSLPGLIGDKVDHCVRNVDTNVLSNKKF